MASLAYDFIVFDCLEPSLCCEPNLFCVVVVDN